MEVLTGRDDLEQAPADCNDDEFKVYRDRTTRF